MINSFEGILLSFILLHLCLQYLLIHTALTLQCWHPNRCNVTILYAYYRQTKRKVKAQPYTLTIWWKLAIQYYRRNETDKSRTKQCFTVWLTHGLICCSINGGVIAIICRSIFVAFFIGFTNYDDKYFSGFHV